ncbi:MAG: glycosyltransferase [Desulfobacterales bacterium]|nr:glycosyltransferase [Desulfobacterales bacterium]
MKILFSSYHNPSFQTITEYIEHAIRAIGHELVSFDDRTYLIPGRLRRRVPLLQRFDLDQINRRLLDLAARVSPDLALVAGGTRIRPGTIAELKEKGAKTVLWTSDAPVVFEPILKAAGRYDFIFCQGSEAVDLLAENGVAGARLLPMACDPQVHRPEELAKSEIDRYRHDVVFIGSYYPVREDLFSELTEFDFGLWGPGWEKLPANSALRPCLKGGKVTPEVWRKIYSASRIVLAPHFRDPAGRIPVHQASPRIFEAMACGGFVMTDRQRDVLALFEDGVHLAVYENASDLRMKIRYYLTHEEERKRIARSARREVVDKHTYVHRVGEMLAMIQGASSPAEEE